MIQFFIGMLAGILLCEIICRLTAGFSIIREACESMIRIVRR